jgi:hypothetical protein
VLSREDAEKLRVEAEAENSAENSAEIAKQNPSHTVSQFLLSCCVEFGTRPGCGEILQREM